MKKKLKIGLIFGGTSQEREVSKQTAKVVAKFLNPKKYEVFPVEVSRDGRWLVTSETIKQIEKETSARQVKTNREIIPIDKNSTSSINVAFLALHGPGGEDGTIQGMLELLRIPYTGSKVLASALAMDKAKTKKLLASEGINVAPHIIVNKQEYKRNPKKYLSKLRGKVVIKPNRIGSSIGVTISDDKAEIKKGVEQAFEHDDELMIEPYLKGREFTVPIMGNKKLQALPVIEIVPKVSEFFDFRAKYEIGASDEIVPAPIKNNLKKGLQTIALRAHQLLECRGVTRSDFIVTEKGQIYFLEINTLPGMTNNSLVPKSAAAAGISFPKLLDRLIQLALDKE